MSDRSNRDTDPESVSELIALGRDREAVDAARRAWGVAERSRPLDQNDNRGEPMDGVQQLDEILPMLEELVDQLRPEDLDRPTACAKLDVTGVLEHMIGGASMFAPAFRGEVPPPDPDTSGTVVERWGRAIADLADAVHAPGAQERTIASPFGEVPGSMFARYVAFDGLVHGWDLAAAAGLTYSPRADVVTDVDAFARDLLKPEMRDGDTFADEASAPADASGLERLVAFSGRQIPSEQRA